MEITALVAIFTAILALGWRLTHKMDKTAADLRGEMRIVRTELTDTRTELTGRIETVRTELTDRIDRTETRLSGEIQTVRTELTGRIDKSETRLGGEIQEVGNKVELLEKRVGHYEQRISYAEGNLNMKFGAQPAENPTAHPIDD